MIEKKNPGILPRVHIASWLDWFVAHFDRDEPFAGYEEIILGDGCLALRQFFDAGMGLGLIVKEVDELDSAAIVLEEHDAAVDTVFGCVVHRSARKVLGGKWLGGIVPKFVVAEQVPRPIKGLRDGAARPMAGYLILSSQRAKLVSDGRFC